MRNSAWDDGQRPGRDVMLTATVRKFPDRLGLARPRSRRTRTRVSGRSRAQVMRDCDCRGPRFMDERSI